SLRWDLMDTVGIDYFVEIGSLDSTPMYLQNVAVEEAAPFLNGFPAGYINAAGPRSRTYRDIDLPLSKSSFEGHGLTVNWAVSDHLTFKSLTGYRELSFD